MTVNTLSPAAIRAVNGIETGEVFLSLVRMSHPDWEDDIRIVPNWEPTTHQGQEFIPYAFEVTLPDEETQGIPVLKWVADNVDRSITKLIRGVRGKIEASVFWVLASSPDLIEIGPFEVEMYGAEYDELSISGTLGLEPILEAPFGHLTMTPSTTPGLH